MPTVTCPTCRARYDPGIQEEVDDLPDAISMKVVCPACGQWVRLPEREPVDPPDVPKDVLDRMAAQSTLVGRAGEPRVRRRDADDDRPRRRRRRVEDDDRPRRSWGDQERDDYDDDPRGPRAGRGDGLGISAMIVGTTSCALALPGVCCVLFGGVSLICGIVAVVLGFIGRGQNPTSGMAKTGIITGFAGIGLSVAMVALTVILRLAHRM
jgi:hypothetical protein